MTTRADKQAAGRERAKQALDRLDEGIRQLIEDDAAFAEYLKCSARMHGYSWQNRLLIWLQRPDATMVAGYDRWKQLGRQVKSAAELGRKPGIMILAPMTYKQHDDATDTDTVRVRGFRAVYVFAIEDTDGPEWHVPDAILVTDESDNAHACERRLQERAASLGVSVSYHSREEDPTLRGGAEGYYTRHDQTVVICRDNPTGMRAKTLAHELAHHLAEHTANDDTRRDAETVAEGAAYVVLSEMGLDTTGYSAPYIAGWAEDMSRVKTCISRIIQVAQLVTGEEKA